jgi:hypothetical protein
MSFEKTLKLQVRRFAKHKMSVFQRFHFTWEQTGLASENENVFLEFEPFFPRPLWFLQKIIDSEETDKKMKEREMRTQTDKRKKVKFTTYKRKIDRYKNVSMMLCECEID